MDFEEEIVHALDSESDIEELCSSENRSEEKSKESCPTHRESSTPPNDRDCKNEKVPIVGLTFLTREAARDFYNTYGRMVGFGTKVRSTVKIDGVVSKCVISCNREGKCKFSATGKNPTSSTSRCKCMAHICVKLNGEGLWQITTVNLNHTHPISSSKSKFERSHRNVDAAARKRLAVNEEVGISVSRTVMSLAAETEGGLGGLGFIEKDARNWVDEVRRLRLGVGDAHAIRMYFGRKQQQNPNFFHLMDIDDEGRLRNVFWADARSRSAYEYFSDVISFDTTYVTNRYDMPFAPFVGVNHHGQSILLGCGLLCSETIATYEWLFSTWLTCMYGKAPQAIVTDQCGSIQTAIRKVFPNTRHRLCLWHIMKKVPEKLGQCKDRAGSISSIRRVVHDAMTPEEFEGRWKRIIQTLRLQNNEWLKLIYDIRHKWVPAFVKHQFWAGMSSTQRSEGINAFFDTYVNSKTSLKQFIKQYEVALTKKYHNESCADFQSYRSERKLLSCRSYEYQMRSIYTHAMFIKFQDQVRGKVECTIVGVDEEDEMYTVAVHDVTVPEGLEGPFARTYTVSYVDQDTIVSCMCRLFEFTGILCRHVLCVFDRFEVGSIPERYIVNRWRKDYKRLHVLETETTDFGNHACDETDRHDVINIRCTRLADLGARSKKKFKKTLAAIQTLVNELLLENDNDEDDKMNDPGRVDELPVHDPNPVKAKGRPKTKLLQSTVEKELNKKQQASKKKRKALTSTGDNIKLLTPISGRSWCEPSIVDVDLEAAPILSQSQIGGTQSREAVY